MKKTRRKWVAPSTTTPGVLTAAKPGPADKLTNSRRRSRALNRNGMLYLKITPNEPGIPRDWRCIGGGLSGGGAKISNATRGPPLLLVMWFFRWFWGAGVLCAPLNLFNKP